METSWGLIAFFLLAGFVLLAKGADWLVDGGTTLARRIGVSTLVIGLTIVAWGTSAPEVVVSGMAAWQGDPGITLGNVLGSNIANIGLVLGACAAVLPAVLEKAMRPRELFWLFGSLATLWFVCSDSAVTRTESFVLLGVFAAHNLHLFLSARAAGRVAGPSDEKPAARPGLKVVLGIVAISLGAHLAVRGAEAGADRLGIDELLVGLTVVAIGTSLPELAAGLGGAFKGETDISLGNVVGSNVFNVLAVLGIVGAIHPLVPEGGPEDELRMAFDQALRTDFPAVLAFSAAAVALPLFPMGGRVKGLLLLVAFAVFIAGRAAIVS